MCVCKFMAAAGKMSVYVTGEIYVLPINVSSCELQHTRNGIMWQWMEGRWGRGKLVENCVECHFSACSVGSLALGSSLIYDIVLSFNAIGILRRVLGKIKFKVEFKT